MSNCHESSGINSLRLREILPHANPVSVSDLQFRSVCSQWQECEPGDLFVAINGVESDGHEFASEAIKRGAIAIVAERLLPVSAPQFLVDDTRVAFGRICQRLAGQPSQRMSTIGVTGTAGKTVTSHLIHSILQSAGLAPGMTSSITTRYADYEAAPIEAVQPPALASYLSKMAIGQCTHAIIEAASIPLAQKKFSGIQLDAAVVTGIQKRQFGYHGSFKNYFNAKFQIFNHLKSTGFAIVNADDKNSQPILDLINSPALTYGIHNPAEVQAKLLERNSAFQTFMLTAGIESIPVRTRIIGKQHIYNCLAAAATALGFGLPLETIAKGIENANIPGRLERIDCGQPFGVWVDSSLNLSQLNGAITALSPICEGKIWCVCSTDQSQSKEERLQIGRLIENKTDHPVITQSENTSIINYEPSHQVIDGFNDPSAAHVIPNRVRAIQWALSKAEDNDVILVAGRGERVGNSASNYESSDRQICEAILLGRNPNPSESCGIFNIEDYR
ncbi:MAG: UDP-N-acetylmuramyl-tripeptide synthetase [Planctomycetota bacterium]